MNDTTFLQRLFSTVLCSVLLAGCGGPANRGPVWTATGTVTHQGDPVTEGTVVFLHADGGYAASAALDSEGKYTMQSGDRGKPAGAYRVSVVPAEVPFEPTDIDDQPPPPANPENIPQQYRDPNTSGLTADVKPGENTFDFALD